VLTYVSKTWTLTKRDRRQLNVFERKVYRRILGKVYDNEKENWRVLTNKEMYASVKKSTITEIISVNRLRSFFFFSAGLPVANAPDIPQPCALFYYP
jgi:hypothetical protein